jgi:hypothetical protein
MIEKLALELWVACGVLRAEEALSLALMLDLYLGPIILAGFVYSGVKTMTRLYVKTAMAGLTLIMGLGIGRAQAITIVGGTSAVVDSWNNSPAVGITIDAEAGAGGLVINKTAGFTSDSGLGISFQQTDADASKQVQFATESITNSTGSDWTGFQFALSGDATIDSVSDVFAPPIGTGVNYMSVDLNGPQTMVTYSGSQLNGATSTWGDVTTADSLLIDAGSSATAPFASFTLTESPIGGTTAVPTPSPLWLSAGGLMVLGLMPGVRKQLI